MGLPGSGKTTLIANLLKLKEVLELLKASGSTGILDGVVSVNTFEDTASLHAASIDGECDWMKVELSMSCLRQMGVGSFASADKQAGEGSGSDTSESSDSSGSEDYTAETPSQTGVGRGARNPYDAKASVEGPNHQETTGTRITASNTLDIVEKLLTKEDFTSLLPFLENKCSLYLSDTGGQIEFQELLPLLISGHAIFIFLFPLISDLDATYPVRYRKEVMGKVQVTNSYESSLTVKESFLQTLSSIDSMESCESSIVKQKSYVFVVGTFKDVLEKKLGKRGAGEKIAMLNDEFKSLIKEHGYEELVVMADQGEGEVMFAVDNTSQNAVFPKIRSRIKNWIYSRAEFSIEFPLSYLLASLKLQDSDQEFVDLDVFAKQVEHYGIGKKDVVSVLQFLHSRIGQIRYFAVKGVERTIVNKPQFLFNLATDLITETFLSDDFTVAERSEVKNGIFSFDYFKLAVQSKFITLDNILTLLQELRIVAPFHDPHEMSKRYFIPCVLNHLKSPPEDIPSPVHSLAMKFDSGHCPKGMFGVLLHCILTAEKRITWTLDVSKIFRDQVSFKVGQYGDLVTVKFHTSHLELMCLPTTESPQRAEDISVKVICNIARLAVEAGIKQSAKSLHYSEKKTKYCLGLPCIEQNCGMVHEILTVDWHSVKNCSGGFIATPEPALYWFGLSKR